MESKDHEEEREYEPRPNDFLVEPMFAPFEKKDTEGSLQEQLDAPARGSLARLFSWLRGR